MNYIGQLQELVTKVYKQGNPTYVMGYQQGPPHAPVMKATVKLTSGATYTSVRSHPTFMDAKQDAALVALHDLQKNPLVEETLNFDPCMIRMVRDATHAALKMQVFVVDCTSATVEERDTLFMILSMTGITVQWKTPFLLLCKSK